MVIFISHSRADLDVAQELEAALLRAGHQSWLDASQIPIGEEFVRAIDKALTQSTVVVMIDNHNFRRSYWCRRELLTSLRLKKLRKIESLISLQLNAHGGLSLLADYTVTSVAETTRLVGRLRPSAYSGMSGEDLHSVVFEEDFPLWEPAVWLGYSDALATFDKWWMSEASGIWVAGIAGQGKTSLVVTWIRALELLGYREAAQVRGLTLRYHWDPSASRWLNRLTTWLTVEAHKSRLVLLDGTDAISDDELLIAIRAVHRAGARFIVTSRREAPVQLVPKPTPLWLSSMSAADVGTLLRKYNVDPSQVRQLIDHLQGHPVALTALTSALNSGYVTREDVLRLVKKGGVSGRRQRGDESEGND